MSACYYLAGRLGQKPNFDQAEVLSLLKRCTWRIQGRPAQFCVRGPGSRIRAGRSGQADDLRDEHLSVGKKAPEVSGVDVDGKTFKFSDYRGKVVVVDFFADWCPYCVRMYPEERQLTEKLSGKPFAILGVNCDSQDTLRQIVADKLRHLAVAGPMEKVVPSRRNMAQVPTSQMFVIGPRRAV